MDLLNFYSSIKVNFDHYSICQFKCLFKLTKIRTNFYVQNECEAVSFNLIVIDEVQI